MAKITLTDGTLDVKKTIIENVVLPALFYIPIVVIAVTVWNAYQKNEGLKEACSTLGGVYIDNNTCIAGKNLFVGKQ